MTAAEAKGFTPGSIIANGERDTAAEGQLANYAIPGVEFSYLKVADINTDNHVPGKVQVTYNVESQLQTILGLDGSEYQTSDNINKAMKATLENAVNTKGKNALEGYIESKNLTRMPLTDASGITNARNLPVGLYLIVETKVPANVHETVNPFFVTIPMTNDRGQHWFYDLDLYPKNATNIPDIDKQVRQADDAALYQRPEYHDTATVSSGEAADYIVVNKLPKISSKATYLTKWDYSDTADVGLAYRDNVEIRFYNTREDAHENNPDKAIKIWGANDKHMTGSLSDAQNVQANSADKKFVVYREIQTDVGGSPGVIDIPTEKSSEELRGLNLNDKAKAHMQVLITKKGIAEINSRTGDANLADLSEKFIVVSYSMTVQDSHYLTLGDKGNTNDVVLTWKRTNMQNEDTLKARARVYSFGLDLTKVFIDILGGTQFAKEGDFTKVKFVLQNATDGHYLKANTDARAEAGMYYINDSDKAASEADATQFTFGSNDLNGHMKINGLEADTYILTEINTSDGFSLLKEPITFTITSTEDSFEPTAATHYDLVDKRDNPHKNIIETEVTRASAVINNNDVNMVSDYVLDNPASSNEVDKSKTESKNALVEMTVVNTPTFRLPVTGDIGTIAFPVLGGIALIGAACTYLGFKKMKEDK